jgi:hypothetical protein
MGLFRSKNETPEPKIAADIERGLVARYLARILERGDLPLRGVFGVLSWMNERRETMGFPVAEEISNLLRNFYSGSYSYADFDRLYRRDKEAIIVSLRQAAEAPARSLSPPISSA